MPNTKPGSDWQTSAIHPEADRNVCQGVHYDTPSSGLSKSHCRQPNMNKVNKTYTFEISGREATTSNPNWERWIETPKDNPESQELSMALIYTLRLLLPCFYGPTSQRSHWWASNNWWGGWPFPSLRSSGGKLSVSHGPAEVMKSLLSAPSPLPFYMCVHPSAPSSTSWLFIQIFFFVSCHFRLCKECAFSLRRPRTITSLSRKPSNIYSFQAYCEIFILVMDMEIYQSRDPGELFMNSGIR